MRWRFPDSVGGRVILILLVGLGLSHVGSIWIYEGGGHGPAGDHAGLLVSTTIMALGILAVSILLIRALTAPLRTLAEAADRLGRDMAAPPLAEVGPKEVRRAAQAFNRMQDRLRHMVAERTQTLAAISHDLRTPITRLHLRAELVEDIELRHAIVVDLAEMESMIDSALAFLRGAASNEEPRAVDLGALLATVIDEAADAGRPATIDEDGPAAAIVNGRPLQLKRAFTNLVDNAVKHGGGAHVTLSEYPSILRVEIRDPGRGIPACERENVFAPFYRLTEHGQGPPGSGLGMTVARHAIEADGGTIGFEDPPGGGFLVLITLPRPYRSETSLRKGDIV